MYQFAPNPSGPMHLGGLRTYFVGWKAAKENSKPMSIRFDDCTWYQQEGYASIVDHLEVLDELGILPDSYYKEARTSPEFTLGQINMSKAYIVKSYWCYETMAGHQSKDPCVGREYIRGTDYSKMHSEFRVTTKYPEAEVVPAETAMLRTAPFPNSRVQIPGYPEGTYYLDTTCISMSDPNDTYVKLYGTYCHEGDILCNEHSRCFAYRYPGSNGWILTYQTWQAIKIALQGVTTMVRGINAAALNPFIEIPIFDYFSMKGYDQIVCGLVEFGDATLRKSKMEYNGDFTVKGALKKYGKTAILDMLKYSVDNDKRPEIPIEDFIEMKVGNNVETG